jgi:hypothetical protein
MTRWSRSPEFLSPVRFETHDHISSVRSHTPAKTMGTFQKQIEVLHLPLHLLASHFTCTSPPPLRHLHTMPPCLSRLHSEPRGLSVAIPILGPTFSAALRFHQTLGRGGAVRVTMGLTACGLVGARRCANVPWRPAGWSTGPWDAGRLPYECWGVGWV